MANKIDNNHKDNKTQPAGASSGAGQNPPKKDPLADALRRNLLRRKQAVKSSGQQ